jgi:RNA recognition motif-containing protein
MATIRNVIVHNPYSIALCICCYNNINTANPLLLSCTCIQNFNNNNCYHHVRTPSLKRCDWDKANLIATNLPPNADDTWLRLQFSPFGLIISARVMISLSTKQSKGFGFVQYSEPYMAEHAILVLNGSNFNGVSICVMPAPFKMNKDNSANSKGEKVCLFSSSCICVNNAPLHFGVCDITALCQHFGPVSVVWAQPDNDILHTTDTTTVSAAAAATDDVNHCNTSWAVRYESTDSAFLTIKHLDGSLLKGCYWPLNVHFMPSYKQRCERRRRQAKVSAVGSSGKHHERK